MPKILGRRNSIANQLLELFDVGKAVRLSPRPDELAIDSDVKYSASTRNQSNFTQFLGECSQLFLCHPRGAKQPLTLSAILDFHTRNAHSKSCDVEV